MIDLKDKTQAFWVGEIIRYEREAQKWTSRSKKIIKRYKDDRGANEANIAKFNILWSNVQTLKPALYAQAPKPNIERRYKDDDGVGRAVSQVLERATTYYLQQDGFNDVMTQAVEDRLLPGRGTAWVRYEPKFVETGAMTQITEDAESAQELYSEDVVIDYVHWEDFGHTWGRTWQEVRAVWRCVPMDKQALKKRWPDKFKEIPMDVKPEDSERSDNKEEGTAALVYEIWDKLNKRVLWVSKSMHNVIEEMDDPLGLMNFFPCPKPIYATLANDSLIPVPDYVLYQDQARELDMLTARIEKITEALKVVGVYDKSAGGIQDILTSGVENRLVPVDNWAIFGEKGGLKGVVDWFPVENIVGVLQQLYVARDTSKRDLYEITGIADIIRGASNPNETATAQQLKGKFATLRLDYMQRDVQRFSRDIVAMAAEIIAEKFDMETIKQVSGVRLMTEQEKQAAQMSQQPQMGPDGQPIPPQPLPKEVQKMLKEPTWEQVEAVLRDDMARCFKIDVETDSTIKADQDAEKQARIEFLGAVGGFLNQANQVQDPALKPLLLEMLMFGVRGFKVGRDLESTFQGALDDMRAAEEEAAQNPKPDPAAQAEQAKMQAESQMQDKEMQLKGAELEFKKQDMQIKQQSETQRNQLEAEKLKVETLKLRLDAKAKVSPEVALTDSDMQEEGQQSPLQQMMMVLAQTMQQGFAQMAQIQTQSNQQVIQAIQNPPARQIVRDRNGRIQSVH